MLQFNKVDGTLKNIERRDPLEKVQLNPVKGRPLSHNRAHICKFYILCIFQCNLK